MTGSVKLTRDHEEIRRWAEARGGMPTVAKGARAGGDETELLRIVFDGRAASRDAQLQPVSWDEFFRVFERWRLSFLYAGAESRFFRFVGAGGG